MLVQLRSIGMYPVVVRWNRFLGRSMYVRLVTSRVKQDTSSLTEYWARMACNKKQIPFVSFGFSRFFGIPSASLASA